MLATSTRRFRTAAVAAVVCLLPAVVVAAASPASATHSTNAVGWPAAWHSPLPDSTVNVSTNYGAFSLGCPNADRSHEYTYYLQSGTAEHLGLDLAVGEGTSVLAVGAGTVTAAGEIWGSASKGVVVVSHPASSGEAFSAAYGHIVIGNNPRTGAAWKAGDSIGAGERIGAIITAFTGAHLHFSLEPGSKSYVDPTSYNNCQHTPNGTVDPIPYLAARAPAGGGGGGPTATVSSDGANLRQDTNTQATVLATIPGGSTIALECWRRGEGVVRPSGTYTLWHRTTYDAKQGFVSDATLNTPAFPDPGADQPAPNEPECPSEGGTGPTATTGSNGANLRSDATTQSAILTTIPASTQIALECWRRGEPVQAATGTYSLWHRTTYAAKQGFVSDTTLNTPAFPDPGADQPAPGEPECPSTTPAPVTPSVAVSPATGDESTVFAGTGAGFTPNGAVSLTIYNPDGTENDPAAYNRSKTADSAGAFAWSWRWGAGDPYGNYRFVATDATGPSADVRFEIVQAATPEPSPGTALGFDASSAPSLATMQAWEASPYEAVGVYLPVAPGTDNRYDKQQTHLTASWVQSVREMGWTVLPIYFGVQAPEACFSTDYWTMSPDPAMARQQGQDAARYAVEQARALGLPATTPVFYDMEAYRDGCSTAVLAFLEGWSEQVRADGFKAGVYGSRASTMRDLSSTLTDASYAKPDAVWVATDSGTPTTTGLGTPPDGAWDSARINQYRLNVTRTYGGQTILVDENAVDVGLLSAGPTPGEPVVAPPPVRADGVTRFAGADRFSTAAAISRGSFPGTANDVFVVTGMNWPDALSAGPAAASVNAPVLPVQTAAVPDSIGQEIARLQPRRAWVIGGPNVVSDVVLDELRGRGIEVVRIAGSGRYETAAAVAARFFPDAAGAYYASGAGYADALGGGAAAAHRGWPLLLTGKDSLPSATPKLGTERIVLGGTSAVSEAVRTQLQARRVAGSDRFSTAAAIARDAFPTAGVAYLATGVNFPDALAGAAAAARDDAPLLLAARTCVTQATKDAVTALGATSRVVLGDVGVVSDSAADLSLC